VTGTAFALSRAHRKEAQRRRAVRRRDRGDDRAVRRRRYRRLPDVGIPDGGHLARPERCRDHRVDTGDDRFLVPIVDKKYIFNYELGKVNNIKECKDLKIIDDFTDQKIHQVQ